MELFGKLTGVMTSGDEKKPKRSKRSKKNEPKAKERA
jgi:hypothetical protein